MTRCAPATLLLALAPLLPASPQDAPAAKAEDRTLEGFPRSRYFLVPPRDGAAADAPRGLLVVLPGGPGSAEFLPFVANGVHAQLPDFHCAMLTAPKWRPDQGIVWPTERSKVQDMAYPTEAYVRAVVADVRKIRKVDERRILLLAWSSSGPAAYAVLLADASPFTGAYVAMSIWPTVPAADLARAKGQRLVLDHSPTDAITTFAHARRAYEALAKAGAVVRLSTYQGGHGWHDMPLPRLRAGLDWLLSDAPAPRPVWPQEAPRARTTPAAAGKNLLANPGFEAGLDGWRIVANSGRLKATSAAGGKEGRQALHLAKDGGAPLDLVHQEVRDLPKGESLTARVWVKTKGARNAWVKCFLYRGDEVVHEDVDVARLPGDSDWQRLERTWQLAGADRAVLQIVMVLGGEVWIDTCEVLAGK